MSPKEWITKYGGLVSIQICDKNTEDAVRELRIVRDNIHVAESVMAAVYGKRHVFIVTVEAGLSLDGIPIKNYISMAMKRLNKFSPDWLQGSQFRPGFNIDRVPMEEGDEAALREIVRLVKFAKDFNNSFYSRVDI